MLTSRSSLLTPAVRAFMIRFSSVSYTSTANCPGKSSSWSSHVAFASFAAGAGVVAAACGAATGSARSCCHHSKMLRLVRPRSVDHRFAYVP